MTKSHAHRKLSLFSLAAVFALALPLSTQAQSSLPAMSGPGSLHHYASKTGACVWYYTYTDTATGIVPYCALTSEFPKIGGRVQTIVNAADPLKSLQTLRQRVPMTRISCPGLKACVAEDAKLAGLVAEMNAFRGY